MLNSVNNREVSFSEAKFEETTIRNTFALYNFTNGRPITKSMLVWWAFTNEEQELLSLDESFEIEHIYARNRLGKDNLLGNKQIIESLGNKAILEKRINIRASDYRFEDKTKYYVGYINGRNQKKEGTKVKELITLANEKMDFAEQDILDRNANILDKFVECLRNENLLN